jgi:hypothetical protein
MRNNFDEAIRYIRSFLLGMEDLPVKQWDGLLGYTDDPKLISSYRIVIHPSGFFDKGTYGEITSMPLLPLQEFHGLPILFGEPRVEVVGETVVIYADLIASAYFLLSRYEEALRRKVRDEHGRFPGKESLPYRAGFINRPIIDEYRLLLRRWLPDGVANNAERGIRFINLSHDIDAPFLYRSWKGFIRSLKDGRGIVKSVKNKFGNPNNDPYYTFPGLLDMDERLKDFTSAFTISSYFKADGGNSPFDKPRYNVSSKDLQTLLKLFRGQNRNIGLHVSYKGGQRPKRIRNEKAKLEKACGQTITSSRHHFLACREPEDMEALEQAGILVDASMGYADVAGFRLGTARTTRYINPTTHRLGQLQLEPLTIMDCTLESEKYMNLSYQEAKDCCLNIIENTAGVGGDISLLWHNTSMAKNNGSYLGELYSEILNILPEYVSPSTSFSTKEKPTAF